MYNSKTTIGLQGYYVNPNDKRFIDNVIFSRGIKRNLDNYSGSLEPGDSVTTQYAVIVYEREVEES